MKIYLKTVISLFFLLVVFQLFYMYNCYTLLLPLSTLIIISSSFIELKLKYRSCSYKCYFKEESKLFKLLSSPYLVVLLFIMFSIGLTISIFIEVIFFANILWFYLILHIGLMILIYNKFKVVLPNNSIPN